MRRKIGKLALFLRLLLFLDDVRDFPKLDRVHHWLIGAVLGVIGTYLLVKGEK